MDEIEVVMVTGGAHGIGRAVVERFGEDGCKVVVLDVNEEMLNATVNELKAKGMDIIGYKCDVSDIKQVQEVHHKLGKTVDILINNAGIAIGESITDSHISDIRKTFDVNFFGAINMIKVFLKDMQTIDKGHIINIASVLGFNGTPKLSDYCASKAALITYTEALRTELKLSNYHIDTTIICPGHVNTGMFEDINLPLWIRICFPRLQPEDVATAIYNAVQYRHKYVIIPRGFFLTFVLKILPVDIFDFLVSLTGAHHAMT